MWRDFSPSPSLVKVYHLVGVDWESAIRVHCHTEESRIGLDLKGIDVPKYAICYVQKLAR